MSQESSRQIQFFIQWKELGNWQESLPEKNTFTAHNPLCGDLISLHCLPENQSYEVVAMHGEACSVCMASAAILYNRREKWNLESLNSYEASLEEFLNDNGKLEGYPLEEINFWEIMKSNPGRHRCAFLPFHALKKAF